MAISSVDAGKTLCELSGWKLSNMALQKILYIAHMVHLGTTGGKPLIHDGFQAWEYGPVAPNLYQHAKGFGSGPVRNVFHWNQSANEETSEYKMLAEAITATEGMTAAKLVSITHWEQGAWHTVYRPHERGTRIPDDLILKEYRDRKNLQ